MNSNSTPFKKRANPFEESAPSAKVATPKVAVDNSREKYTATMESSLRKRLKVASAMTGVQVSTYIELACKEKLEKEGY